jgi:predicted signal transduction protein with EAL and GGDEF domain
VGVAQGLARDASSLLRHADIAMYRAKRQGLGWAVWDAGLDAAAEVVLHELTELRHALGQSELRVDYQPLVACSPSARRPGRTHLVQALVRWQHPRRGLLAPVQFLPLVARAGLMRTSPWSCCTRRCTTSSPGRTPGTACRSP